MVNNEPLLRVNIIRIYRRCESIIVACVGFLILYFILPDSYTNYLPHCKPILMLETVALWAFGTSWITKGKLFWDDAKNNLNY